MKITIETIPHEQQRYPTIGDWVFDGKGDLTIRVSALGDWRYEALIAVHELVEVLLCKHQGVSQEAVDQFDLEFERKRTEDDTAEPGDALEAPYRKQHCFATGVERLLASELGVGWKEYEERINTL
jgi:hypothetical protein